MYVHQSYEVKRTQMVNLSSNRCNEKETATCTCNLKKAKPKVGTKQFSQLCGIYDEHIHKVLG